jgi:hypothetical protein
MARLVLGAGVQLHKAEDVVRWALNAAQLVIRFWLGCCRFPRCPKESEPSKTNRLQPDPQLFIAWARAAEKVSVHPPRSRLDPQLSKKNLTVEGCDQGRIAESQGIRGYGRAMSTPPEHGGGRLCPTGCPNGKPIWV